MVLVDIEVERWAERGWGRMNEEVTDNIADDLRSEYCPIKLHSPEQERTGLKKDGHDKGGHGSIAERERDRAAR